MGKIFIAISYGSFFIEDVKGKFAFYSWSPVAVSCVSEGMVEENFTNAQSTVHSLNLMLVLHKHKIVLKSSNILRESHKEITCSGDISKKSQPSEVTGDSHSVKVPELPKVSH